MRSNDIDRARQLISQGADVNLQDARGATPLQFATARGQYNIVEILISSGADVAHPGIEAITALHVAARFGHLEIAQLLLLNGANADPKNARGRSPMLTAV